MDIVFFLDLVFLGIEVLDFESFLFLYIFCLGGFFLLIGFDLFWYFECLFLLLDFCFNIFLVFIFLVVFWLFLEIVFNLLFVFFLFCE